MIKNWLDGYPFSQIIDINGSGLRPGEVKDAVLARMDTKSIQRPLARKLEEDADYKALLTSEIDEEKEPRRWSLWKLVDPVALAEGKVLIGKPEFGCEYNGHVFVFDNEETQQKFIDFPRKYLAAPPKMPAQFRLGLLGPQCSGKRTQAKLLSEKYGWPIVEVEKVMEKVVEV
jgi:adenylate/nucleoside-diphosphate kinase